MYDCKKSRTAIAKYHFIIPLILISVLVLSSITPVYALDVGKAILDVLDSAVAMILKAILTPFEWILSFFLSMMSGEEIAKFVIDPAKNFYPLFTTLSGNQIVFTEGFNFYNIFVIAGISLCLLNAITGLYFCMVKENNDGDSPLSILFRTAVSVTCIVSWSSIMNLINSIFFNTETGSGLFTFFKVASADALTLDNNTLGDIITAAVKSASTPTDSDTIVLLLTTGLEVALVMSFFRLYMEVIQRWILCNILYICSPLGFSLLPSKGTMESTFKYIKGYIVECMIMTLNILCVQIATIMLKNFAYATEQADFFITQNVILYLIIIIGFLIAANKLDNYMSDLGLTAIRTGGSMAAVVGGGMMATFKALKAPYRMAQTGKTIVKDAGAVKNAIGRKTGFENATKVGAGSEVKGVLNRAKNQRYSHVAETGEGQFTKGMERDNLMQMSMDGKIGTMRKMDAANYLATNTASSINGEKVTYHAGKETYYDPSKDKGHANVTIGSKVLSGSISRSNQNGSVDLGNGYYMSQDNGSKYIGNDLTYGLQKGEIKSLAEYEKDSGNSFKGSDVGMPDATHVSLSSTGGINLLHAKGEGKYDRLGSISYNSLDYGGTEIKANGQQTYINGNAVYGGKTPTNVYTPPQGSNSGSHSHAKNDSQRNTGSTDSSNSNTESHGPTIKNK